MRMKSVWPLLLSMTCLCIATTLAAKSDAIDNDYYTSKDKEFYLTPEQIAFIRPGLDISILSVVIPADMRMEVTYSIKDPRGLPLDHDGIYTPGAVDMRFVVANIPMDEEQKVRLAYERINRNGTLSSLGDGVYKYKFDAVISSDQSTTHTLVLGGRRNLEEFGLDEYADNDVYNWVPSGMYDPQPRDVVTTETCNRCHGTLIEHGRWLSPAACTQCHNESLVDDGVSYSLNVMIHRIHNELEDAFPTSINNCEVCHTGGTPTENFPLVANPNPVPVCDMSSIGTTELNWGDLDPFEIHINTADGPLFADTYGEGSAMTGKWVADGTVFVLVDKATGDTIQTLPVNATVFGCVSNAPGAFSGVAGTQHTNWLDHPSRVVCGSCHTDIDFENGVGHFAISDDDLCSNCHKPYTGNEFDASIRGAHLELYKSVQFPGVLVKFFEVTNTAPGDHPTVTFSVGSKNGPLNPAEMNRLRFKLSGPNDDFSFYASENVENYVQSGDNWAYTFSTAIPEDAEGSYTISVEARTLVDIVMGSEISEDERDTAENSQIAFAVTDATTTPRRKVVSDVKCENCHSNLAFHGGNRHDPDYCVVCHMPEATGDDQAIHFKYMVHSIHRGEYLENGYAIGRHIYDDVKFPGNLANCDTCHVGNSQQISSLPAGLIPTATPQAWWDPMLPQAAACLSCHDGDDAAVHAFVNTAVFGIDIFGESCATCHGEGKEYAVDKVHMQ